MKEKRGRTTTKDKRGVFMSNSVKSVRILILAVYIFSASITTVSALTITNVDIYTQSLTALGVLSVSNSVNASGLTTPFDPSLGTLEGIDITFAGSAAFTINAGTSVVLVARIPTPIPYTIYPKLSIDIDGVNGFYEFASPLTLTNGVSVTGLSETKFLNFNYSFTFSYIEFFHGFILSGDVYGGVVLPFHLGGDLTDFIDSATLLDDLSFMYELSFIEANRVSSGAGAETSITVDSTLTVNTTYTYAPATVPEPSTLLLLGTGIAGLFAFNRKRKPLYN